MSRHFSHLNSATQLVELYDYSTPFSHAVKAFFRAHKKFGSKDRRAIRALAYGYFRLGGWNTHVASVKEQIIRGHVFSSHQPSDFIEIVAPQYVSVMPLSILEKCRYFKFDWRQLFPLLSLVSPQMDAAAFATSHLQQPDVFLRYRAHKESQVTRKLRMAQIDFEPMDAYGVRVAPSAQVDKVLALNADAVIQDYGSQQVRRVLEQLPVKAGFSLWDCCAASGGKSILAADTLPSFQLTVSDVRATILKNLALRFKQAGIRDYQSLIVDLSVPIAPGKLPQFDVVMADVPCSGSGTWGRTPERILQVTTQEVADFQRLQTTIASHAFDRVKKGGYLVYITCSVFTDENEAVLANIPGETVYQQLFCGTNYKSDSMFMALVKKN